MSELVFKSYLLLIRLEILTFFRDIRVLHTLVRDYKVRDTPVSDSPSPEKICRAVDLACVFYPKRVLCLQYSAATAILLRRYGMKAEMVIGAQVLPFKSHAWVEINGLVVNDKPYVSQIYQQLERC